MPPTVRAAPNRIPLLDDCAFSSPKLVALRLQLAYSRRSQPSWAWRTGARPGGVEAFNALESSAMRAAKSWRSEIVSAWRSSALGSSASLDGADQHSLAAD